MSQRIKIEIKDKIAKCLTELPIVCGNADYVVDFVFDGEWEKHDVKTAVFVVNGKATSQVFAGNVCPMPVIQNTLITWVGVFAGTVNDGTLSTSTPALVKCIPCITDGDKVPLPPPDDAYNQIIKLINSGMLEGPQGEQGPQGEKGETGAAGVNGKSAYEIALKNGFEGTEEEWLKSFDKEIVLFDTQKMLEEQNTTLFMDLSERALKGEIVILAQSDVGNFVVQSISKLSDTEIIWRTVSVIEFVDNVADIVVIDLVLKDNYIHYLPKNHTIPAKALPDVDPENYGKVIGITENGYEAVDAPSGGGSPLYLHKYKVTLSYEYNEIHDTAETLISFKSMSDTSLVTTVSCDYDESNPTLNVFDVEKITANGEQNIFCGYRVDFDDWGCSIHLLSFSDNNQLWYDQEIVGFSVDTGKEEWVKVKNVELVSIEEISSGGSGSGGASGECAYTEEEKEKVANHEDRITALEENGTSGEDISIVYYKDALTDYTVHERDLSLEGFYPAVPKLNDIVIAANAMLYKVIQVQGDDSSGNVVPAMILRMVDVVGSRTTSMYSQWYSHGIQVNLKLLNLDYSDAGKIVEFEGQVNLPGEDHGGYLPDVLRWGGSNCLNGFDGYEYIEETDTTFSYIILGYSTGQMVFYIMRLEDQKIFIADPYESEIVTCNNSLLNDE